MADKIEQAQAETVPEVSEAQAKAVLAKGRQARAEACRQELAALLQKHRCRLVAVSQQVGEAEVRLGVQIAAED
jgi:uncharacterized protein with PIN domain